MARYVARRLLLLLPAWLIMGSVAFALIRLIPGDPAAMENAILASRLDMIARLDVVQKLDVLEDFDVIERLDSLPARRES